MNANGSTILLVEDNPDDVLLIRRAFQKAGIGNPIVALEHGDEALAYLDGRDRYGDRQRYPLPTLMLLDLKLPRRSGLEVLAWVRQHSGLKRLPIVVLSSSRNEVDINRAYDLGANSYLVKPVAFDDLLRLVRSLEGYWLMLNVKPDLTAA
ncbi:MAG: two-component system response regulator [Gemmatimonadetes bacterium 13_1_40CM_4_69_8]|nr:MAG: two-component system response regulator [Gemmatimonadetes bacterium 13_1_40CM_70_15]OLC68654.1 MAG: two-component system response regulator [Gemmatimonadetes bacterium 13_1_40CM_4_69_8]PYP73840.1 MAG: two-component system response regulator [Gemmatimonadota bacterium]